MNPGVSRRSLLQVAGGVSLGGLLLGSGDRATAAVANLPVAQRPLPALTPAPVASAVGAGLEPTVAVAEQWWPRQRQVWTPIGWKGHLIRFDQFYNGTTVCQPAVALPAGSASVKPYLDKYKGKDFQVTPVMPIRGGIPPLSKSPYYLYRGDYGVGIQGWEDSEAPTLWTEWRRQEGFALRQRTFAHLRGSAPVDTAEEPLFAWSRYEFAHIDPLVAPGSFEFALRLSRVHLQHYIDPPEQQEAFVTMQATPAAAPLAGALKIPRIWNPGGQAIKVPVTDADGLTRLVVGVPAGGGISLKQVDGHQNVFDLVIKLPVATDAVLDVLMPMVPMKKAPVDTEWNLGWDGARAEAESFWAPKPATSAMIDTAEPRFNAFFHRSPQLAEVIAEKSPDSGKFTFLSGSFGYDLLWSTPTSMISHMFLDLLGYHEVVERHIELYLQVQGKRTPPGAAYRGLPKDGFFATPASLQAFDWVADHGAVLEAAARHALLSHDQAFIDRWLEPIIAACDFIKRACELRGHPGVAGLMPAAASNDTGVEQQSIWIQAWNYKGLVSAVRLLTRLGHERAGEFDAVATAYREAFVQALRAAADTAPKWTHPDGTAYPVLPSKFFGPESPWPYIEAFDNGALIAVWAGLMPADDPLMRSYLEFFRVGPNTRLFDPWHHTALDRVVLDREQSSAEPCYSWNLFHTWQLGDRDRFLEGMFGLLTGAISETFVSGEHRNAMYGNLFVQPLQTWAARACVIDDEITAGELHLLRLFPLSWLKGDGDTRFERMPTLFGPMSLVLRRPAEDTLEVDVALPSLRAPDRAVLHVPPIPGLQRVVVNGITYSADSPISI